MAAGEAQRGHYPQQTPQDVQAHRQAAEAEAKRWLRRAGLSKREARWCLLFAANHSCAQIAQMARLLPPGYAKAAPEQQAEMRAAVEDEVRHTLSLAGERLQQFESGRRNGLLSAIIQVCLPSNKPTRDVSEFLVPVEREETPPLALADGIMGGTRGVILNGIERAARRAYPGRL